MKIMDFHSTESCWLETFKEGRAVAEIWLCNVRCPDPTLEWEGNIVVLIEFSQFDHLG